MVPLARLCRDSTVWHLLIKLIQDKTHAARERRQVVVLFCQGVVKRLEISHPFGGEGAVQDISFVEDHQKWGLALVEDGQGVEHVGHECVRVLTSDSVSDIQAHGWEGARESLGDYLATGALRKCLNLARSVHHYIVNLVLFLANEVDHLVELGSEKVQASQDGSIWSQLVRLHHLFVLDAVPDVYAAGVRHL